jgi:O-antigen/teichoic acid export membrane protein
MKSTFNKIGSLSKGLKASIALFLASMISKGISYITTPLFTRLLTTEEYGQVSVYLTWVQVFGIISMFCLSYGVFNNGMVDYPDKRDEYSFSLLILSNVITLTFCIVFYILYPFLNKYIKMDFPLTVLMFLIFVFQPAYNFWTGRQRYELKYKATFIWSVICAVISPSIALICIYFNKGESNLYQRIFGAEVPLIIVYIAFYFYIAKNAKWKLNTVYWKAAFLFNLPLIPHYLSTFLLGSSDKIMISNLVSDTATAYYSVAHSVAAMATIIWTAINASLVPYTYENCKKNNFRAINNVTLPILTLFGISCIGVIMLAPEVVRIMATKNYMEAIYVIPPIVGGVFFQVQYFIYANVVYYYKKPKYVMVGSVTAVCLNILLNYIFIKRYGYAAAGYTTIFCYIVQALIDYCGMKKAAPEKIYNMRYIFTLSMCLVVISLASVGLYDKPAHFRYLIILAILVVAIINRKKIIGIWNDLKNR